LGKDVTPRRELFSASIPECLASVDVRFASDDIYVESLSRLKNKESRNEMIKILNETFVDAETASQNFDNHFKDGKEQLTYNPTLDEPCFFFAVYVNEEQKSMKLVTRCSPLTTMDSLFGSLFTGKYPDIGAFFCSDDYHFVMRMLSRYAKHLLYNAAKALYLEIPSMIDHDDPVSGNMKPKRMAITESIYFMNHAIPDDKLVYYNGCSDLLTNNEHIVSLMRITHPAKSIIVFKVQKEKIDQLEEQGAVIIPLPYDTRHDRYDKMKIRSEKSISKLRRLGRLADESPLSKETVVSDNKQVPFIVIPGGESIYVSDMMEHGSEYENLLYISGKSYNSVK
jgi:hypothetical protein